MVDYKIIIWKSLYKQPLCPIIKQTTVFFAGFCYVFFFIFHLEIYEYVLQCAEAEVKKIVMKDILKEM